MKDATVMKTIVFTFDALPNEIFIHSEPLMVGEYIVYLMVESGQWQADNIPEEEVLLLADKLLKHFGGPAHRR